MTIAAGVISGVRHFKHTPLRKEILQLIPDTNLKIGAERY